MGNSKLWYCIIAEFIVRYGAYSTERDTELDPISQSIISSKIQMGSLNSGWLKVRNFSCISVILVFSATHGTPEYRIMPKIPGGLQWNLKR